MKNPVQSQLPCSLSACEKAASLQDSTASGLRANSFGVTTPALGAVAAGGVALCGISDVDGAIVMADSVPGLVAGNDNWDVNGDAVNDFGLNGGINYITGSNFFNRIAWATSLATNTSVARGFPTANTTAYDVAGVVAGATNSVAAFAGGWTNGVAENFAFQFKIGGVGGTTHNGWGTMTTGSLNITQAYYNDSPGGAINVGQVPEPSTAGLLALTMGAVGMRRFRKQKQGSK